MNACRCTSCSHLYVWPNMPYMDPPSLPEAWADPSSEWRVACHWLGPLINGCAALIRRGMRTDGGSIPRAAWSLVGHPWQMPALPAFLQHDAEFGGEFYTREVCDDRLYKSLIIGKVDPVKARLIYDAVRLGGGECWSRHTPATIAYYRSFVRIVGEEEYNHLVSTRIFPA